MSDALVHPSVGTAALTALLGYAVVFFGILLLLVVVVIMGKIMVASQKKAASAVSVTAGADGPTAATTKEKPTAKGSAGELKLHDVEPKDAALVMAIVAHQLQKPLNELRFRSIKEVKDE